MHAASLALQKLEQNALARERMAEGEAVGPLAVRDLEQQLRLDRRSEGADEDRLIRADHAGQEIEIEVLADDRGVQQDVLNVRR